MLKAYEVFPESFADHDDRAYSGSSNGVADVLDEVRQATDYLLKTHPDSSTLVVRVGGSQDHDLWVTSPYQSTLSVGQGGGKRPVQTGGRADIAGLAAAALALMSTLTDDAEHAQECLDVAESLYVLGNSRKGTTWDLFYADETWQDDMLCAAVELYRATGYEGYLDDARALDAQIGSHDWVLSWAQVSDLCRHGLYDATGDSGTRNRWSEDVDRYVWSVSSHPETDGLAWFSDWGSLRYAVNAAFAAALYAESTGDDDAADFALSQLAYVMGENDHDRSFVVGFGCNPPTEPHHANAYGHEALDWDLDREFRYSLDGAMVGGPTQGDYVYGGKTVTSPGYEDEITDFIGNEVTITYNGGLVGLAAYGLSTGKN